MMGQKRVTGKNWFLTLSAVILALPFGLYGQRLWQRPAQTPEKRPLFRGVDYRREFRTLPRPLMIHQVRVDLSAPGLRVQVTPSTPAADDRETEARTTTQFAQEFGLQVAVNANFFYPFREKTPWDYYPYPRDRVNSVGQAIANGNVYSPGERGWPALCFSAQQRASIVATGVCPPQTQQAVAGSAVLVQQGKAVVVPRGSANNDGIYSRTAVALDRTGQTLWLIAIDDKQPFYSEGVTLAELSQMILELGADAALNLDGGGSTTLVAATATGAQVLNAPIHTKLPMRERPVANHLGFYAQPLPPD